MAVSFIFSSKLRRVLTDDDRLHDIRSGMAKWQP